eukprot:scaffold159085_cov18-Prasinocladus_malaysianus.AAC.1
MSDLATSHRMRVAKENFSHSAIPTSRFLCRSFARTGQPLLSIQPSQPNVRQRELCPDLSIQGVIAQDFHTVEI